MEKGLAVGAKLTTIKIISDGLTNNSVAETIVAQPVDEDELSWSAGHHGNGLAKRLGHAPSAHAKRLKL